MVGFFYTLNYKNKFMSLVPFFMKHLNQNNIVLCLVTKDDFNNSKKYFSPPVDVHQIYPVPIPPTSDILAFNIEIFWVISFRWDIFRWELKINWKEPHLVNLDGKLVIYELVVYEWKKRQL